VLAAACLGVASLASLAPLPAHAGAPMVKTQAPGYYRVMLGDFEITVLSDGSNPLAATRLLQGDASRITAGLRRHFLGDIIETAHNGFLINTGSKLVLIDPGAGTMLGRSTGDLVANLRAAGYRPEQVDEILITHMHTDHVGGLVADGRRAFPNAVVRIEKRDVDYWLSASNLAAAPEAAKRFFRAAADAVAPYLQAGKLVVFDGDTELLPGVRARSAYGHTPGHVMYLLESKGEKLLVWGDIVHVAAVQMAAPLVTIGYDVDPDAAARERLRVFADAAKNGTLVAGAHLPFPGIGHVRRQGDNAYAFVPLNDAALK